MAFVLDYTFKDVCTVSSLGRLRKDLHLGHRTGLFPEQNNKDNILPEARVGQLCLPHFIILRFC